MFLVNCFLVCVKNNTGPSLEVVASYFSVRLCVWVCVRIHFDSLFEKQSSIQILSAHSLRAPSAL